MVGVPFKCHIDKMIQMHRLLGTGRRNPQKGYVQQSLLHAKVAKRRVAGGEFKTINFGSPIMSHNLTLKVVMHTSSSPFCARVERTGFFKSIDRKVS